MFKLNHSPLLYVMFFFAGMIVTLLLLQLQSQLVGDVSISPAKPTVTTTPSITSEPTTEPVYPNQLRRSLTGRLEKVPTPAVPADTTYDYQLVLDQPLTQEADLGGDRQPISMLPVHISNGANIDKLQMYVGKQVSVTGYLLWGYAESRYFEIEIIEEK